MDKHFFLNNRRRLAMSSGDGLFVFSAYTKMQDKGDEAHRFRQEANFWYLTGIEHADWQLIIDGKLDKSWLVAPEVDRTHELFDGSLSYEDVKRISSVDEVLSQAEGEELLRSFAKERSIVYTLEKPSYANYVDFTLNPAPQLLLKKLKKLFTEVRDCRKDIARLRAIKQHEEVEVIRQAIKLSIEGFEVIKSKLTPGRYEYEIEAELGYYFRRHNATHAFEPIVASGKNACTLHYTKNNNVLTDGLLLIDAGAQYNYYPGDVTRTFGVGELTYRQRKVHEKVEEALSQIKLLLKPGPLVKDYAESVDSIMKDALVALGLMKTRSDTSAYRRYFPHAISHGLGLDVHESLGGYEELMPGMLLTVEPGIYIPEEGIGVRIEDDILITEQGSENLTADLSTDL